MNQQQFKEWLSANHFVAKLRSTEELKDLPGNKFDIYLDGTVKFTGYVNVPVLPRIEDAEEGVFYILPDGSLNYIDGGQWQVAGTVGPSGATYTPFVDADGWISWSNDKGLPNPPDRNIKGPAGDGSKPYHIRAELNTTVGGFSNFAYNLIDGITSQGDIKAGFTQIWDDEGTVGIVVTNNTTTGMVRIQTITVGGEDAQGVRLGTVDNETLLPTTSAQAQDLGWNIPNQGDFAYVRADSTHDDKLAEWFISSVTSVGNYVWTFSHVLNAGSYQLQSLSSWDGLILTGSEYDGEFGDPIDPATLQKATDGTMTNKILVGGRAGYFGSPIDLDYYQRKNTTAMKDKLLVGGNGNEFGTPVELNYYQKANTPAMLGKILVGGLDNEFGTPADLLTTSEVDTIWNSIDWEGNEI